MMYATTFVLLSLVTVLTAFSACNRGFEQYGNMCYKVSLLVAPFQQAAWQCELDGGDLASVSNAFIDSFVRTLAERTGVVDYWIGLRCPKGNISACYWIDAAPFSYDNFYFGYPSADYGETTAVSLQFLSKGHGKWYTSPSHMEFRYVCEQNARDNTTTTLLPTTTQTTTTVQLTNTSPNEVQSTTQVPTTTQTTTTVQLTSTASKEVQSTTQDRSTDSVVTSDVIAESDHPKNLRKLL